MMKVKTNRNRCAGFSLIELLVVIAIIAILAAILFPVFTRAKTRASATRCLSNQKQIALAARNYISDWNNRYIPAPGFPGSPAMSCQTYLRPYLKNIQVFFCPSTPKNRGGQENVWNGDDSNVNAGPDGYWTWTEPNGEKSSGSVGMNINLGGFYPGPEYRWDNHVPIESEVREPSRVVFFCDARWVDLNGYMPGRIGVARMRHSGGLNTLFADCHAASVPAVEVLFITAGQKEPSSRKWRWDYR